MRDPGAREAGLTILDIRKVQLCKLDESYVNALKSFPTESQDQDEDQPLFAGLKLDF